MATLDDELLELFYDLSVVLTGFSRFELQGTGVGESYFTTAMNIVGRDIMTELIVQFVEILQASDGEKEFDRTFRKKVINDDKLGPVAANLIKMWYLGNWEQLPNKWRDRYVNSSLDVTKVVSAAAYREGLVWLALETHPQGAKPTGFGTWGEKPGFWPESDHK